MCGVSWSRVGKSQKKHSISFVLYGSGFSHNIKVIIIRLSSDRQASIIVEVHCLKNGSVIVHSKF